MSRKDATATTEIVENENTETETTETETAGDRSLPTKAKYVVADLYAEAGATEPDENGNVLLTVSVAIWERVTALGKAIVDSSVRNIPVAEKLRKLNEKIAELTASARDENGNPRAFTPEEMTELQKCFVKRNNLMNRGKKSDEAPAETPAE